MWLALGAVLLLAGGGALLVPLVRAATSGEPATTKTVELIACAHRPGDDYCQRIADDRAARDPMSTADRDTAARFAERLRAAFEAQLGAECRTEIDACVFSAPPSADAVRAALKEAGFSAPVVRQTRLNDPAPFGAVVYGVRAGAACLVGWIDSRAGSQLTAVGRHRDGSCLPA